MKAINSFTLTMLSRSTNEAFARSAVSAFVTCLDPTLEEINDIKTAVSEAVTNCIVHGYRDTIGKIYIAVQIFPDNVVSVKVRDTGCGETIGAGPENSHCQPAKGAPQQGEQRIGG